MGCSPWGREESDSTERLHFHFSLSCIGEGNGNPLQCSCLENSRNGGARWASISGVAQSWTRLKQLGSSSSSFVQVSEAKEQSRPLTLLLTYLDSALTTAVGVSHTCFEGQVQFISVTQSCPTLCDPMDCSPPICPWGVSRQKYWSGKSCSPPEDLPNPGTELGSPAWQMDSLLA